MLLTKDYKLNLNIHYDQKEKIELFQIWLNIWCGSYCVHDFEIAAANDKPYQLEAHFSDPSEAFTFMLGSAQYGVDIVS